MATQRHPTNTYVHVRHVRAESFAFVAIIVGAIVWAGTQHASLSAQGIDGGGLNLFDGQTLEGWEGDLEYWRVDDGAIVGEIATGQSLNKNTWLVWRGGVLEDFDLRLQFKLSGLPAANSGIQFRCQVDSVDHVSGYQADLDMGATWLGRIYDEHGRALLVERGSRVDIEPSGKRKVQQFAPAQQYEVLFREDDWNDYRIVAVGEQIAVYVNGTLFSELRDSQVGERDLTGALAFQLHSGPQTRVEFRNIELRVLNAESQVLKPFPTIEEAQINEAEAGQAPLGVDGRKLNLDFERGDLSDWEVEGGAFRNQPVKADGISSRWPGQVSQKQGDYFIGGYEIVGDAGTGSMTSSPFEVTRRYLSLLVGGGGANETRVEIISAKEAEAERVLYTITGTNREQMDRVSVDLQDFLGKQIAVRIVDASSGAWGHLNVDDIRLHDEPPSNPMVELSWRSTSNPLLQHLVVNAVDENENEPAHATLKTMYVPEGFSVDTIAAEPQLHQPMAFAFDARGSIWVVEGFSYPQRRPEGEGLDRILIFSDEDDNGDYETRRVFAEGLNLVSGMEVGFGGVWLGAAPHLIYIPDRDGDYVPDSEPQILLDGFGFGDTHETVNSFMWGPDGWLYGNQGVFNDSLVGKPGADISQRIRLAAGVWRYHPTRHIFEVFAHGGSNQWGLDYDEHGQIFMTHCRSYWGRGPTTHVMQGGHYWNQVNAGYAPFISSQAMPGRPWMSNYLLASARYGHGEGGAGKRGSREVYGGHSHVGTMLYLGDNWPAAYRNHLFTHSLHGHQINHQINMRDAGGYNTVHAGSDVFFCSDPQYIGVDLQYGPDGAVYISDWYDPRHCHNPDAEQWDRGNGRIYRMKYDATWKPAGVDYVAATDLSLAQSLNHPNDWHGRMCRNELAYRASSRPIEIEAVEYLKEMLVSADDATERLDALWTLHSINGLTEELIRAALIDDSEYVRAWAIQLGVETAQFRPQVVVHSEIASERVEFMSRLIALAREESSLLVQRYLAMAMQRLPQEVAWQIAEGLCAKEDAIEDRDLPLLIWQGLAPLVGRDSERAFRLAGSTVIRPIKDYIYWYSARTSEEGRAKLVALLVDSKDERDLLRILEYAVRDGRNLGVPKQWPLVAARLYKSIDVGVRREAISIGASLGDRSAYELIRTFIESDSSGVSEKQELLQMLAGDNSPENVSLYLQLIQAPALRKQVIPLLAGYDDPRIASALLSKIRDMQDGEVSLAMECLCSRPAWANMVLDRIASGELSKDVVTAYYARQMFNLGDVPLSERLSKEWGRLGTGSQEMKAEIAKQIEAYKRAPLWAYNQGAGESHFKKLCAQCHTNNQGSVALAPSLAGTGSKGIEYLIENVLDPNAVIGRDYQATIVLTTGGRVVSGLVERESDTSLTIRTQNDSVTLAKDDIEEVQISPNSFMPQGLLDSLNDRERIELFLYLMRQP